MKGCTVMKKSMYSIMLTLLGVGVGIWAIPLVWYSKQKKE